MFKPVVIMSRSLQRRPQVPRHTGLTLRCYLGSSDDAVFLALRTAAFETESRGVGPWTQQDFAREFTAQPWWSPKSMWFACDERVADRPCIGSGALSIRHVKDTDQAAICWLLVHPNWRRQGVGSLLVRHLEQMAWDQGHRKLSLETHAAWQAARAMYQSLGFATEA